MWDGCRDFLHNIGTYLLNQCFSHYVSRHNVFPAVARCIARNWTIPNASHKLNSKIITAILIAEWCNLKFTFSEWQRSVCHVHSQHGIVPKATWHKGNYLHVMATSIFSVYVEREVDGIWKPAEMARYAPICSLVMIHSLKWYIQDTSYKLFAVQDVWLHSFFHFLFNFYLRIDFH